MSAPEDDTTDETLAAYRRASAADAGRPAAATRAAILAEARSAATARAAQTAPPADTTQPTDQLQEVVVTGIRASLQRSMDIKQNAIGVVDAISSEDIGQFPDANIGDAIARIPGVTVNTRRSSLR